MKQLRSIGEYIGSPFTFEKKTGGLLYSDRVCLGIEMELEGAGSMDKPKKHWKTVPDHTLRNKDSFELIFNKPKSGAEALEAITMFYDVSDFPNWACSELCSSHVHFDMRWATVPQAVAIASIFAAKDLHFYSISNSMGRVNNPYSWTAHDNYGFWKQLGGIFKSGSVDNRPRMLGSTSPRKYTSINLDPLRTFGTIELRHSWVIQEKSVMLEYINTALEVIEYVIKYPDEVRTKTQVINCVSKYKEADTRTITKLLRGLL